jgi:hypothetical protein
MPWRAWPFLGRGPRKIRTGSEEGVRRGGARLKEQEPRKLSVFDLSPLGFSRVYTAIASCLFFCSRT